MIGGAGRKLSQAGDAPQHVQQRIEQRLQVLLRDRFVCSANQSAQRRQMPLAKLSRLLPRFRQSPGRSVARHRQQRVGYARHRAHHNHGLLVQAADHDIRRPVDRGCILDGSSAKFHYDHAGSVPPALS